MSESETLDDYVEAQRCSAPSPGLLVVQHDTEPHVRWLPLDGREILVGRAGDHGLDADGRLSREHAVVRPFAGGWEVEDLDSRNGTFVDGAPVVGCLRLESTPRVIRFGGTLAVPLEHAPELPELGFMTTAGRVEGPLLREALLEIETLARQGKAVLVVGETGTGKEEAARRYHRASPHADGPFLAVNCATLPPTVADRLIFGAVRGAFSGALDAPGLVRDAEGGVLFLDELGELHPEVQAKLLRTLETKEIVPVGATRARTVRVHFVLATHRPLAEDVSRGLFRQDLYYRLMPSIVRLPPLRERPEEIPWLIRLELSRAEATLRASPRFTERCMLEPWPGNIRALLGAVQRIARRKLRAKRSLLMAEDLQPELLTIPRTLAPPPAPARASSSPARASSSPARASSSPTRASSSPARASSSPVTPSISAPVTPEHLRAALDVAPSARAAAKSLGIHRSHLYRLMNQFGMNRKGERV